MRYLSPNSAFVRSTMLRHARRPLAWTPPIDSKLGKRPSTPSRCRGSASVMSRSLGRRSGSRPTPVRNYEASHHHSGRPQRFTPRERVSLQLQIADCSADQEILIEPRIDALKLRHVIRIEKFEVACTPP